jgi:putative component of toxin-antitoxin plasmid stabilization module
LHFWPPIQPLPAWRAVCSTIPSVGHSSAWLPFDWAILIPYFAILLVLSILRFASVRDDSRLLEASQESHRFDALPNSSIRSCRGLPFNFLSINEQYVIERLIEETAKLTLSTRIDLLQIQVLDDSTDDTTSVHRGVLSSRILRAPGFRSNIIHRNNRARISKPGALQERFEDGHR